MKDTSNTSYGRYIHIYIYIYIAIGNKEVTHYGLLGRNTLKQSDQLNNLILCSMNIYITGIIILYRGVGRLENSTKMYWYFVQKSAVNNRVKNLKICLKNYNEVQFIFLLKTLLSVWVLHASSFMFTNFHKQKDGQEQIEVNRKDFDCCSSSQSGVQNYFLKWKVRDLSAWKSWRSTQLLGKSCFYLNILSNYQ